MHHTWKVAGKGFTRGNIGSEETHSMMKNGIPSFIIGFKTRFNTVVHKQITTMRNIGTTTLQHGGQHITRFRLGGRDELSEVDRS